jgi:hypothetical protein
MVVKIGGRRTGMSTEKWLTYEREWSGGFSTVTRMDTEKRPTGFGLPPRRATQNEITQEKKKRADQQEYSRLACEFRARQDYRNAEYIRSTIECMDHTKHPLDRLTPAEWAELRRKLE